MLLYCTGSAPRNKPAGFSLSAYNLLLEIGGVMVKPGDMVGGDEDGMIVIPLESLETFMENIKTMFEVGKSMSRALQDDAPA